MDKKEIKEINNDIMDLWETHYKKNNEKVLAPLFYPNNFEKGIILFIEHNPSYTPKFEALVKERYPKIKSSEIFFKAWKKNDDKSKIKYIRECAEIEKYSLEHYVNLARCRKIAKENNKKWAHLDLFFNRITKQNKLKLKRQFKEAQLAISFKMIKQMEPSIIIVANAESRKILSQGKKRLFKDALELNKNNFKKYGFHTVWLPNKAVPIFFSSVLAPLDDGSFKRLRWQIKNAIILAKEGKLK